MHPGTVKQFPYYDPWVGADYADRKRRLDNREHFSGSNWFLHVLGESHYVDDPNENGRDLTKRVVCRYSDPRGESAIFFNRVLQAAQGCDYYDVDRVGGWSDIAFSNYVQEPLSASRVAPDNGQWASAAKCLVSQLAITKPRVLLVLGKRLWDWFLYNHSEMIEIAPALDVHRNKTKVEDARVVAYQQDDRVHFCLAVWSYHPSSSKFDADLAHDRVVAADMAHDNVIAGFREQSNQS